MSYLRQMYVERKKQMEQEAMANKNDDGVEARFICNKIIKKFFRDYNKNDLRLTYNRLNRLVLLVDIPISPPTLV